MRRPSLPPQLLSAAIALTIAAACSTEAPATLGDPLDTGPAAQADSGVLDDSGMLIPGDAGFVDAGPGADATAGMDATAGIFDGGADARYLQLHLGETWTYHSVNGATAQDLVTTVEAFEDIGGQKAGVMAFRVRKALFGGGSSVDWQQDTGTAMVRHRDTTRNAADVITVDEYDVPYRLRLDEAPAHLVMGATWTETYQAAIVGMAPANKTVTWRVLGVNELLTTPLGTFSTLHVSRGNATPKQYWFARGIGKVKEVSAQTELLVGHTP